MDNIKFYVEKFKNSSQHDVLNQLKINNDLSVEEKNLIYLYLFPRPLLDMELPQRIISNRKSNYPGSITQNLSEIGLLVEAYRTEQYKRFIKHLIHSFIEHPEKIYQETGYQECKCGLCGKPLYQFNAWEEICSRSPGLPEVNEKKYLAYSSRDSNINLCLPCIIQLKGAADIIESLEPGYLDWHNRYKIK